MGNPFKYSNYDESNEAMMPNKIMNINYVA
jgi:hypothetical protein